MIMNIQMIELTDDKSGNTPSQLTSPLPTKCRKDRNSNGRHCSNGEYKR